MRDQSRDYKLVSGDRVFFCDSFEYAVYELGNDKGEIYDRFGDLVFIRN